MNTATDTTHQQATAISAASFLARFEAAWRSRDVAKLGGLLHPDIELIQPIRSKTRGRRAAIQVLTDFLSLMPDAELAIHDAVVREDTAFIDFSFTGTIGRRPVQLRMMDSIELSGGLIRKRVCCFDPSAVWLAIATQPRMWPTAALLLAHGKGA
jgi:ketosteroid isomerase-like protein